MNNRNIHDLLDATAYDNAGDKLGGIKEVFVNDETGQPDFVEVGHGLFGMSSSLVPLRGHRWDGEDLHLAFSKEAIKDAPNIDVDSHISDSEQATIYRHYSLDSVENTQNYEPDYARRDDERVVADADYDRTENRATNTDDIVAGTAEGAAYGNTADARYDNDHVAAADRDADYRAADNERVVADEREVDYREVDNESGEEAFDQRAGVHQTNPGEHHVVDHRGDRYEGHEAPAVGGAGQPAAITPEQEAQAAAQRSESSYTDHPVDGPMEHTLPGDDYRGAGAAAAAGTAGVAGAAAARDDRDFSGQEPEQINVTHAYDNAAPSGAAHDSVDAEETIAERNNLPDETKTIEEERAADEGMVRFHRYERRTDIDPSLR